MQCVEPSALFTRFEAARRSGLTPLLRARTCVELLRWRDCLAAWSALRAHFSKRRGKKLSGEMTWCPLAKALRANEVNRRSFTSSSTTSSEAKSVQ